MSKASIYKRFATVFEVQTCPRVQAQLFLNCCKSKMAHVGIQIYAQQQHTSKNMRDAILEIVNSDHFDREAILGEIKNRRINISEAFCLLWQNSETGDVSGRQAGIELNGAATAVCIVDLIILGKAEIEVVPGTTLGVKKIDVFAKVKDPTPTGTFLDKAIFNDMLEHHKKNPENPKKLKDWIMCGIQKFKAKNKCSTITLDSLVEKGILDKKESMFSIKYPTSLQGPERELADELNKIALENAEMTPYMRVLLTMLRAADDLLCFWDPLLKKHFPKEDYPRAKERIKSLVKVDIDLKKKYEGFD